MKKRQLLYAFRAIKVAGDPLPEIEVTTFSLFYLSESCVKILLTATVSQINIFPGFVNLINKNFAIISSDVERRRCRFN